VEHNEANGRSVLVVEDESSITKVCMRTLTAEGFQVDFAKNGEVAQEMWKRKNHDLCISDIRTPRMNGIELYRQLETDMNVTLHQRKS
jgi:CheY-like chemotaxis protein